MSVIVSRGRWREWTRQAIPRLAGTRVLEVPCGTGNLLLDLMAAEYNPVGVDLSPSMVRISQRKLNRSRQDGRLLRARVQDLPFLSRSFDTIVMTFPPEFIFDPRTFAEFRRVLAEGGRLVWVDAGRLLPRDAWSRLLNWALDAVAGGHKFEQMASELLTRAGFDPHIDWVKDEWSVVAVLTARPLP